MNDQNLSSDNLNEENVSTIRSLPESENAQSYDEERDSDHEYGNTATFALESLQNIIRNKLDIIEKSQIDVSETRTRLNDMLANSEEYYTADKAAKEALKLKKQVKATIMSTPEAKQLQEKMDADRELLSEQQESLSEMLLEYYETLRVKEIDDSSGEPRDLKVTVKVMPKKFVKR